jgi:integrase
LTAEAARKEAKKLLGDVERGRDPSAERKAARQAETVAELCDRFLEEHARQHKRQSSYDADERNIRNHVKPVLGRLRVADVTRADVDRLKRNVKEGKTAYDQKEDREGWQNSRKKRARRIVKGGPGAANRVLALTSKMFNLAERWGLRPDGTNPCRHVEKYKEQKQERYLSADELARLADALSEAERTATELPGVVAAVRLLVLTGCRLSEILTLRWEHVDFANACLRLPESKTGAKVVHLNAPALEVLSGLKRLEKCPWVVLGAKTEKPEDRKHLVNLEKPWRRIRAKAGLNDVRLHDLRHSFASVAVGLGEGLPMIGKLLRHTQTQTTARYAHLAADPVKAATERVGAALAGMMNGKGAEVVELPRQRR